MDREQPAATPARAEQPGACARRRIDARGESRHEPGIPLDGSASGEFAEAAEVGRGGQRIDGAHGFPVFLRVGEDVAEGVADGARSGEGAAVPAFGKNAAGAKEQPIEVARAADGEAPESGDQGAAIVGFDDEVDVIGLDGEVDDAESAVPALVRAGDRVAHRGEDELGAEGAHAGAQCDVHGLIRAMFRACTVRRQTASRRARTTRPRANTAATSRKRQRKL
jgi:hypothetical protein